MKLWIPILSTSLLMTGCATQYQTVPVSKQPVKDVNATKTYAPAPPKKNIELKEVEDTNFSSEYMYPETKKKKPVTVTKADSTEVITPASAAGTMSKGECITMIGQEKFDKYTQMLGDEASAIKRCQMLKIM